MMMQEIKIIFSIFIPINFYFVYTRISRGTDSTNLICHSIISKEKANQENKDFTLSDNEKPYKSESLIKSGKSIGYEFMREITPMNLFLIFCVGELLWQLLSEDYPIMKFQFYFWRKKLNFFSTFSVSFKFKFCVLHMQMNTSKKCFLNKW